MDLGVQGLDPAVQHFGETGEVRDLNHGDGMVPQELGGAAGGEDFHLVAGQELGEFRQTALISDTHQGPGNGLHQGSSVWGIFWGRAGALFVRNVPAFPQDDLCTTLSVKTLL